MLVIVYRCIFSASAWRTTRRKLPVLMCAAYLLVSAMYHFECEPFRVVKAFTFEIIP